MNKDDRDYAVSKAFKWQVEVWLRAKGTYTESNWEAYKQFREYMLSKGYVNDLGDL